MVKGRRITKKELREPDEFITVTERAVHFVGDHGRKIIMGGVVVLIIAAGFFLFRMWEEKKEAEARRSLGQVLAMVPRLNAQPQEAMAGEYKAVTEKLDEIIARFPRTTDGRFALLYKGNIALRLGDHDGAIKSYSAFLDEGGKERLYQYFALEGLGEAYKGKKEYDKALQSYQKIVSLGEAVPLSDAYFNIGLCYERLGRSKEALESYKEFTKIAQKSQMTNIVLRKIALLEK